MFCPNCGQDSGAEVSRFCRTCGFRLDGVSKLVTNNGVPDYEPSAQPTTNDSSARKQGLKTGGKLLVASLISFPLIGGFSAIIDDGLPMFLPMALFVAALARLFYAHVFEDDLPDSPRRQGIRTGWKLMLSSIVSLPLVGMFAVMIDEGFPLFAPLTLFIAGFAWAMYARLFEDTTPTRPVINPPLNPGRLEVQAALPEPRQPAFEWQDGRETDELHQPRAKSITDRTTDLLNRQ